MVGDTYQEVEERKSLTMPGSYESLNRLIGKHLLSIGAEKVNNIDWKGKVTKLDSKEDANYLNNQMEGFHTSTKEN